MLAQRVWEAESRIEHRLSNGPLRVQSKARAEYSATWRHTSVARDMMVSYGEHREFLCEARWHRERYMIQLVLDRIVRDGLFFIVRNSVEFFTRKSPPGRKE